MFLKCWLAYGKLALVSEVHIHGLTDDRAAALVEVTCSFWLNVSSSPCMPSLCCLLLCQNSCGEQEGEKEVNMRHLRISWMIVRRNTEGVVEVNKDKQIYRSSVAQQLKCWKIQFLFDDGYCC